MSEQQSVADKIATIANEWRIEGDVLAKYGDSKLAAVLGDHAAVLSSLAWLARREADGMEAHLTIDGVEVGRALIVGPGA